MTDVVQPAVLVVVEEIDRRERSRWLGGHRHQDSLEALDERVDACLGEDRGVVFDAKADLVTGHGLHRERIVVVFLAGESGNGQFAVTPRRGGIDRVVVEGEQGVEEPVLTRNPVHLAERQVLMLERGGVRVLQLIEKVCGGRRGGEARPNRHRVDHQTHHRIRTGDVRRPARDRGAEDHVVVTGQPPEQLRVRALQHDVDGGLAGARQLRDCPRGFGRHRHGRHAPRARCGSLRRTHKGRGVETGQHVCPGHAGSVNVPIGQPADELAVRHRGGQALSVVTGEDLAQQDRQ